MRHEVKTLFGKLGDLTPPERASYFQEHDVAAGAALGSGVRRLRFAGIWGILGGFSFWRRPRGDRRAPNRWR